MNFLSGLPESIALTVGVSMLVVITSVWVLCDALRIGVRKGLRNVACDLSPFEWFACCLLVWGVGFPCYLWLRPKLIIAARTPFRGDPEGEPRL